MNNGIFPKLEELFNVFMCEAAIGKTYTIIETLKKLSSTTNKLGKPVKTLIVTKFIAEGKHIASELNKFKSNMAKDENSDNKEKDEKDLVKYEVLIITHSMYKILCKFPFKRKYYIEDRTNLIIDEELNMVEMDSLSDHDIDRLRKTLRELKYIDEEENMYIDIEVSFNRIMSEIIEKKDQCHDKSLRYFEYIDKNAERAIEMLKIMVNKTPFPNNYAYSLDFQHNIKTNKSDLLDKLEILKKYFNNPKVLVSNKTLYTFDDDMEYLFLENNILLDASGKFHELYKIGEQFKLIDAERIFPHNNWTIHISNTNSTKTAKHNDDSFYKDVVSLIIEECTEEDNILVLGLEEDISHIKDHYTKELLYLEENIKYSNFQNMRGKNDWKDFNKCFLIHTPMMPPPYYVFMYMLYTGKIPTEEEFKFQKIHKNMGFKYNETLENLRKTDIVSGIYQGIKRINRGTGHIDDKADVYLINGDIEIVDMIIRQLKDINIVKFKLHKDEDKKERKPRKQNNIVKGSTEFIGLLNETEFNKPYLVNYLLQQINYDPKSFNRLWKDKIVQESINKLNLEIIKIKKKNYLSPKNNTI